MSTPPGASGQTGASAPSQEGDRGAAGRGFGRGVGMASYNFVGPQPPVAHPPPNPLTSPGFAELVRRLARIGAGQPDEAEALRRQLLAHLHERGLAESDLARRLGDAPEAASVPQIAALKAALEAARADQEELAGLQRELQMENRRLLRHVTFAEQRVRRQQQMVQRAWGVTAGIAVTAVLLGVFGFTRYRQMIDDPNRMALVAAPPPEPAKPTAAPPAVTPAVQPVSPVAPVPAAAAGATGRPEIVTAQNAPLFTAPSATALTRAILQHGARIVVIRTEEDEGLRWNYVQSDLGSGYVLDSAVAPPP